MSKFIHDRDVSALFQIGEQFKNRCLINQSSMFTDERLWTTENNKYLISDFVNSPDEGDRNFIDKLEEQLKRSPSNVKKLAAEMLYMLLLCPSNIGPYKKREVVETIWNWSGDRLDMSASMFADAALQGAGSAGTAFNTGRWREFNYIINFIDKWSVVDKPDQVELLNDKWKFSKWLEIVPENEARQFRHMILYMLYPDSFERIFSYGDRIKIVSMYTGLRVKDIRKTYSAFDMDKKLLDIRNNLIIKNNGDEKVDFYIKPWDGWRSDVDVSLENNSIPENISREHILKAIEKIDLQGIPNNAKSTTYDLIYEGKRYPPKYVVSLANLYANGIVLNRDVFEGGAGTECFRLLEKNGFEIIKKTSDAMNDFYPQLDKFIQQSKTGSLATKDYISDFMGLKVDVSFGMGVLAKVPWISFLGRNQQTSNGIYPVYLLYKELNLLVLAKGVSETNRPNAKWNVSTSDVNVKEFLHDKYQFEIHRYGGSYVFRSYNLNEPLNQSKVNQDLNDLIEIYKDELSQEILKPQVESVSYNVSVAIKSIDDAGLKFNKQLVERFSSLILTKPFMLLTGLSGSGKTKLAQAFSSWICQKDNNQCLIVPVGADWTNREPLLGYPNALNSSEYIKPDSGVVDLLINASNNPGQPYFLILDEMNLSHVERYFADFLSLMESGEELKLHSSDTILDVPKKIKMPQNLFVIGTVNIDETTYMFSPKVLDRAGVIEFRVDESEMKSFLSMPTRPDLDKIAEHGVNMAADFVRIATTDSNAYEKQAELNTELLEFFVELKKVGAEFGYRTAFEINRFAGIVSNILPIGEKWTVEQITDAAIIQKLLPKLHGSQRKLSGVLKTLAGLCLKDKSLAEKMLESEYGALSADQINSIKYKLSFEKIHRMYQRAKKDGFTSFAEA